MNILYIHGFDGSPSGRTGKFVKSYFKEDVVVAPQFDLEDYAKTMDEIRNIVRSEDISIVIGHSLGGFYALSLKDEDLFTIAINPCMMPSVEIPKLTEDLPEGWVEEFEEYEEEMIARVPGAIRQGTFGIFGSSDELFSYSDLFTDVFGASSVGGGMMNKIVVSGGHIIPSYGLERGLTAAVEYFGRLNTMFSGDFMEESVEPLEEHFINVETSKKKDPNIEKYKQPIFDLLQKVYKSIGGPGGLDKPDDLVNDSDFWKIDRDGDEIKAAAVYTFKRGGRKLQYIGSDGTEDGKKRLYRIIEDDMKRPERHAWAEVSGAVEHSYLKQGAIPVDLETVKKIMPDKNILPVDKDDPLAKYEKNDVFDGYHYKRKIGGHMHIKLMVINVPDSAKGN